MPKPMDPQADLSYEAHAIALSSAPGAVFLRLRRRVRGDLLKQMVLELEVDQAIAVQQELERCIRDAHMREDGRG